LNQALTRLALSWGLIALGSPDAEVARDDAKAHLDRIGLVETEWDAVFRRAAGLP
jgi:hypothetical protein